MIEARVGLMVPSSNTIAEPDFARGLPGSVGLHVARMFLSEASASQERVMVTEHAPRAAAELGTVKPDVLAFACTSAGAVLGTEGEAELERELARISGARVVSTNASVSKRLAATGAHRVMVLTPYVDELNRAIKATLEARGFDVAGITGMGIEDNFAIGLVTPSEILEYAGSALGSRRDFDALFVSCTNYRAMEAIRGLRELTGVPVVTSNQATLDMTLDALGLLDERARVRA